MRNVPLILALALSLSSACGDAGGATTEAGSSGTSSGTTSGGTEGSSTEGSSAADSSSGTAAPTTSGASSGGDESSGETTGALEDLDMRPEDFTCILQWDKVRRFRVTNLLGHLDAALAVANDPMGGTYPVGTVIQLVPGEAMVKRAAGWAPENSDWEFFALDVSAQGTTIAARGTTDVVNAFGGNCFDCHAKAEPQWDRICEDGHGCDPLPITPEQIEAVQNADPRCP